MTGAGWLRRFEPTRSRPFDLAARVHVLRRAVFAHPPSWLEATQDGSPSEVAAWLVNGAAPDARERRVLARRDAILALDDAEATAAWLWSRLLTAQHPLRARMMLFWHDHFATALSKVRSCAWMVEQFDLFEQFGLGSFRDLLGHVSTGPAMLRWLDAESNRRGNANENLARELFELFTLGRGNYTEEDVREAARAFTGWRILRGRGHFDERLHDRGPKRVLGRDDLERGLDVLALVCDSEQHARFVAERLLRTFVGPDRPARAVDDLARVYRDEACRIDRTLEVLLASEVVHDSRARNTRVRSPAAFAIWILRTLGLEVAPIPLHRAVAHMGQELLEPPDVSGWAGEEAWLSSATWLARARFASDLGRAAAPLFPAPRLERCVRGHGPERELDALIALLFPEGTTTHERTNLLAHAVEEARRSRDVRLAGTFASLLLLPRSHRF
ncbi:MAG: DUF1800 family protein [Planctomycetes bacterium]|nr:DUF1800 family protein [Planctomycetota bacterium]